MNQWLSRTKPSKLFHHLKTSFLSHFSCLNFFAWSWAVQPPTAKLCTHCLPVTMQQRWQAPVLGWWQQTSLQQQRKACPALQICTTKIYKSARGTGYWVTKQVTWKLSVMQNMSCMPSKVIWITLLLHRSNSTVEKKNHLVKIMQAA